MVLQSITILAENTLTRLQEENGYGSRKIVR